MSHPKRMGEDYMRVYRRRWQMLLRILPGRSFGPSFFSPGKFLPSKEKLAATFDGGVQEGEKADKRRGDAAMCHPSIGSDERNLPACLTGWEL